MLIGVIADDFTGASDIANTLAKGGLATSQYLGVPGRAAASEVEAGVVSLKSRSIPAQDAVAASLEALRWLQAQGCRQFVFKYCSTFDSTPEGNIGPVAEALADALGVKGVVVCPAFPATGRTVYQGHLFVGDRLLNESGMREPPADADDRRRHPSLAAPADPVRGRPRPGRRRGRRGPPRLRRDAGGRRRGDGRGPRQHRPGVRGRAAR